MLTPVRRPNAPEVSENIEECYDCDNCTDDYAMVP